MASKDRPTQSYASKPAPTESNETFKVKTNNNNSDTGRPPTTSFLRSAMYYQNRIIIPDKKRSPTQINVGQQNTFNSVPNSGNDTARSRSLQQYSDSAKNSTSATCTEVKNIHGNHLPNTDDAMDAAGIDIVVTDTENREHTVQNKSLFKRFFECLQDNRMKGNPNAEEILANSSPQEYRILKKILNTTFLSIGIALLIAVVIVIIYSAIAL